MLCVSFRPGLSEQHSLRQMLRTRGYVLERRFRRVRRYFRVAVVLDVLTALPRRTPTSYTIVSLHCFKF